MRPTTKTHGAELLRGGAAESRALCPVLCWTPQTPGGFLQENITFPSASPCVCVWRCPSPSPSPLSPPLVWHHHPFLQTELSPAPEEMLLVPKCQAWRGSETVSAVRWSEWRWLLKYSPVAPAGSVLKISTLWEQKLPVLGF